ncbi:RIP metalloprotease RseP [Rhodovastum sp. RN2-1]|uniref:Zinc metalloprotease n=1 Tax=Limobrevibacterium gyesilva TaxID=2991712 RepID=A0AA41YNB7_9PROT|nr:RIP metalloprotease RseP [Limobrevibacterium gyesilva]MCW3475228.1 RIP metalloprotease RseP [Limobrevibacterium gyesilva]
MPSVLRTPLAFVIVLGVLVFIHELGHYLAARWRGVHVEAFSIGFGKALASWTDRRGTAWKLAWIPLGGYVKLHGMERPQDVEPEVRARWIPGRTFHEKSVLSRAIVVAAGPVANFILAAVLFFALFAAVGRPVALPEVGEVIADSAAAKAGLQQGDRITGIDDSRDSRPVNRFEDLQRIVAANPGQPLILHIRRGDAAQDIRVTPEARDGGSGKQIGVLGVRGGATVFEQLSIPQALVAGVGQTWDVTVQTLAGVWSMIAQNKAGEDLGGPLRIAQLSGQVASLGFASLVSFIAVLSVNLGLINLFPIPVLDGGHLLFYAAEAIRGRPLPPRAQEYGFRAGFALLIGLFVFATWNDLAHIGLFRWVAGLIG